MVVQDERLEQNENSAEEHYRFRKALAEKKNRTKKCGYEEGNKFVISELVTLASHLEA